ncbi:MAG: hypothetical protein ACPGNT_04565 [Rhodospirillales bacterium]
MLSFLPTPMIARLICLLVLLIVAAVHPAFAADDENAGPKEPEQLQLKPAFLMPIAGSKDISDIVVYLIVPEVDDFWPLCRDMPKVRNSVNEALYRKGLNRNSKGVIDYEDAARRIIGPINKLMGKPAVAQAVVVYGHLDDPAVKAQLAKKAPNPVLCDIIAFRQKGKAK